MSIEVKSFRVMCPMDNTLHDALARISVVDGDTIVGPTECHKSCECDTCIACLVAMRKKYENGDLNLGVMEKPF